MHLTYRMSFVTIDSVSLMTISWFLFPCVGLESRMRIWCLRPTVAILMLFSTPVFKVKCPQLSFKAHTKHNNTTTTINPLLLQGFSSFLLRLGNSRKLFKMVSHRSDHAQPAIHPSIHSSIHNLSSAYMHSNPPNLALRLNNLASFGHSKHICIPSC